MKHLIALLFLLTMTVGLQAQSRNDLKGPAAKNYKVWQNKDQKQYAVNTQFKKERLMGPEAKNRVPWENKDFSNLPTTQSVRKRVTGPDAKNRKPWITE